MTKSNKSKSDLSDAKDLQIKFAPGCFDNFEGTQQELDDFITEITAVVASGELTQLSQELTDEDFADLPQQVQLQLLESLDSAHSDDEESLTKNRRLQ